MNKEIYKHMCLFSDNNNGLQLCIVIIVITLLSYVISLKLVKADTNGFYYVRLGRLEFIH